MKNYRRQQTGEQMVEERLEETRANDRRARLMLEHVRDLAEAWCLVKPTSIEIKAKLDETRVMIEESVRECWGEGSYVEFSLEPYRRVTARHSDGRQLVIGEENNESTNGTA